MEKIDKKKNCNSLCVKIGFYSMLGLFILMLAFSMLKLQWPGLISGILFVLSVFFVFVTSIRSLAPPEKSLAYIALGIAIIFILYILLSASISAPSVIG